MNPEDFHTRSSIISKFILKTIDGEDSGEWLMVEGTESSPWRKNRQDRMKLRLLESLSEITVADTDKNSKIECTVMDTDRDTAQLLSVIVASWSFDKSFSQEVVEDFLYNTPYIMDELDRFVFKKNNFLKKK